MKKKLIYINVAVFAVTFLLKIVFALFRLEGFEHIMSFLEVPASLETLLLQPWTLVTYMFMHYDVLHILFNMLWLYWLADLFVSVYSSRHLVGLYLLGGFGGALLFILAYNVFPYFDSVVDRSYLLGASASVLSVMGALMYRIPNYEINLMFLGRIRFKYMALFIIGMDLLFMMNNPGQHFAHLGGALTGLLFAYMYSKNTDLTKWINAVIDFLANLCGPVSGLGSRMADFIRNFGKRKPKMKVRYGGAGHSRDYEDNLKKRNAESEIDQILEKIKKRGYGSLTEEEKRRLFDASRK